MTKPKTQTAVAAKVDTKIFTEELKWVNRFIETRTQLPILANVQIVAKDGHITLIGTDLEIGGISEVETNNNYTELAIAVPARQLLKYLEKVQDEELDLSVKDNNLNIEHGRGSTATINGMSVESYPELPVFTGKRSELRGLLTALPRVLPCTSQEESRFTLNGALLVKRGADTFLVSTDGYRLGIVALESSIKGDLVSLIGRPALGELANLKEDSLEFGTEEHHQFFFSGSRQIVSRTLTGRFPDWERVMPKTDCVTTINAKDLLNNIERVMVFADERSRIVRLTLCAQDTELRNTLRLSSSISDIGQAEARTAAVWEGPEWQTGLNGDYIQDFLRLIPPAITFDLRFCSYPKPVEGAAPAIANESMVMLQIPGWRYIVMSMRTS